MSAQRTLRRTAAIFAAATVAALAAVIPATAAHAADDSVQVSIGNLSSSFTAGSRGHSFTVRLTNKTKANIVNPHVALAVHLDGLSPDQVDITRTFGGLPKSNNGGDVVFTDPEPATTLPLTPGRSISRTYTLTFGPQAPSGQGQLTAIALSSDNSELGSGSAGFSVHSGNPAATASPTPGPSHSASPAATVPVAEPTATVPVVPLGNGGQTAPLASNSSGVPVFVYIMGAVLVAMGGAILWVLFRNPRGEPAVAGVPDEYGPGYRGPAYQPTYPPDPGPGFGGARTSAPTAQMPIVRDPRSTTLQQPQVPVDRSPTLQSPRIPPLPPRLPNPDPRTPPPVDPWASQNG
jgi:hypothetical protein